MKTLRAGVVGVGHIGKSHARVYSEIPHVQLAAVFDTDPAAAAEVAGRHSAKAARSLEELADLTDAISVCTPTPTHHATGLFLLGRGKHLLVEKPIAADTAEAQELADAAERHGLVLQVGHVERFNPVMGALEKRLRHPRFIESHRLSPYPNRSTEIGVVLDLMIHDLEVILHLVRAPLASLDAVGIPVLSRHEDIANARLRFEGGCVANVTVSRISPERMRKIRVFQEDAYLSLDYGAQEGVIHRKGLLGIQREEVPIEKGEPLRLELESFLECARDGREPKVGGRQASRALELALRITREITEQNRSR